MESALARQKIEFKHFEVAEFHQLVDAEQWISVGAIA